MRFDVREEVGNFEARSIWWSEGGVVVVRAEGVEGVELRSSSR